LRGGNGGDYLDGGVGPDVDVLYGDGDNDFMFGRDGNDNLNGGGGNDSLNGEGGDDTLIGGDGDDTFYGGPNADDCDGQGGVAYIPNKDCETGPSYSTCESQVANIVGSGGNNIINGDDLVADVIDGKGGDDTIRGFGGDDIICGGGGDDELHGDSGNDFIRGNDGDDDLFGEAGVDALHGGPHVVADTCTGTVGTDTFTACETIINVP
jgi:Ca2+-binding RTX toxin-like protein